MSQLTQTAFAASQIYEFDVFVNGYAIDEIGEFHNRNGKLFITTDELDALGFIVPGRLTANGAPPKEILLTSIPGVSYRVDEQTQTIFVTAPNRSLKPTLLQAEGDPDEQNVPITGGFGADLNYDVVDTYLSGRSVAETLLDGSAFSPFGLLSASATATAGAETSLPPFLRLNTTYSFTNVDKLQSYEAGDFISGGLNWSRPVRMAGIQIASDFGVRPDLVTFPVPTIAGQVAVPSSVDVLVNGVQLLSQNVPTGPFQIDQLPVVTGAGSVSVVTRNSAGQQSTLTVPFYSSTLLLKPGLSAYSAEIGAVRLNYGFQSNDYQAPAALLSYRYGLNDWLTVEGHAEAIQSNNDYAGSDTGAGGMGGGGAAFILGHSAVASIDMAASRFGGRSGAMVSTTIERMTPILSVSGGVQLADRGFTDVAASYGQPFPTLQGRASIGLALPHLGSFGIAFVEIQQARSRVMQSIPGNGQTGTNSGFGLYVPSILPQTHVSLLSASYSRAIFNGRAYAFGNAFTDLSNTDSAGLLVGISFAFGSRGSVDASFGGGGKDSNENLQASQSANSIGDFGWQVIQGAGSQSQQLGSASYKSAWALVDAGADRVDGQTAYRGDIQGAIAVADGNIFATNTIYDSFAVVDTDKTAGIEVLQENRPIAKTGKSGLVLVPDLRSFDINRLSIDPNDVPLDAQISSTTQSVRPQDHSGVVVHFPIRSSRGALIHLVSRNGKFIPIGSSGHLVAPETGEEVAIGYEGEAFLTGLGLHNKAIITLPDGSNCVATFDYHPTAGLLPEIRSVLCEAAP